MINFGSETCIFRSLIYTNWILFSILLSHYFSSFAETSECFMMTEVLNGNLESSCVFLRFLALFLVSLESLDKNLGISWISWHDLAKSCKLFDFLVRVLARFLHRNTRLSKILMKIFKSFYTGWPKPQLLLHLEKFIKQTNCYNQSSYAKLWFCSKFFFHFPVGKRRFLLNVEQETRAFIRCRFVLSNELGYFSNGTFVMFLLIFIFNFFSLYKRNCSYYSNNCHNKTVPLAPLSPGSFEGYWRFQNELWCSNWYYIGLFFHL